MRLRRPEVNPQVRTAVSVLVVLVFVSLFVWKVYTGQRVNPVTYAIIVAFALAAGYGIWGEMFGQAVEEAKEMTGQESGDDDATDGDE